MRITLAIQAFFKALREPDAAKGFLKTNEMNERKLSISDQSHLRLLALLQQSARLVDFIKEDLSTFDDIQVGAAVRKIQAESSKCLEELLTIRPIMEENEGAKVVIPQGYDPSKIKIIGKVKGEPPFSGTLIHKGWKVHKRSLPKNVGEQAVDVIFPAEVEIR